MALLIKSSVNLTRLTAQVKKFIIPQITTLNYSSKVVVAMDTHEVVPDVIPVAPSDKIEVRYYQIL